MPRFATHPDTAHAGAGISERRTAHSSHPVTSAIVLAGLLLQPLFQKGLCFLRAFLPAFQRKRALASFFLKQIIHFRLVQPFQKPGRKRRPLFNPLEKFPESQVKPVIIRLPFYKKHPGKHIKIRKAAAAQPLIKRLL